MSQLVKNRVEGLHREFVNAAHKFPNLRFLIVHPHDPVIPWPEFPASAGGSTSLGLTDAWWHEVLAGLDPTARRYSNLLEPIWLSLERVLWQGVFYVQESLPDDTFRSKKNSAINDVQQLKAGVDEFLRLATLAANHFDVPKDPFFWDAEGTLLEAERSHRWLERLLGLGLDETCEGGVTQVRRLKANVFAASARAIEILSDRTLNWLHSRISAADESWRDGYDLIAKTVNGVLEEKGKRPMLFCRSPVTQLSLSACRQRLVEALAEIPARVSCMAEAPKVAWQPWPIGRVGSDEQPTLSIGSGNSPLADEQLSSAKRALQGKPNDWNWSNSIESIQGGYTKWNKTIEEMHLRTNGLPLVEEDPTLSETEQEILIAMLEMKAIDANARRKGRQIAVRVVGSRVSEDQFKKALAKLVKMNLLGSEKGRSGGYWLTAGYALAAKLRPQMLGAIH